FRFPKQKLVYGPNQVKALINQDPQISEKLSLWSRSGSQVVFGPVMVIPIADSMIYVTPLYLRSVNSQMPALKKVLLTYGNHVEMADTLDEGLNAVFGPSGPRVGVQKRAPAAAPAGPQRAATAAPQPPAAAGGMAEIRGLAREADTQYRRAQDALREGDWAAYGAEMKRLEQTLSRLRQLAEE
ncbi:MAG: UPF0182 family protein, partial [Armatimonadota bacterium]|nr:UPF0182 family protein [Armatimonadota bacterium]